MRNDGAEKHMHGLRIFRSGSLSRADCTHRLVCNRNMRNLVSLYALERIAHLLFADNLSVAGLPLLKKLADTEHYVKTMCKRHLYFFVDNCICLAENMPALTVSKNHRLHADVGKH